MTKTFLKFDQIITRLITVLVLIPVILIAIDSIIMTAVIPADGSETTRYFMDMPWIHLISTAVVVCLLAFFKKQITALKTKYLILFLMTFVLIAGLCVVFLLPLRTTADQWFVLNGAENYLNGEYKEFDAGGYLYIYPHQLGMVWYLRFFVALAGGQAYVMAQIVNILWVMIGFYSLYKITTLIFADREITNVALFLMLLCFQILLYVLFVYGNIPAFGLGLLAVMLQLKYFKERKLWYALVSAGAIAFSVLLRNNNLIWLIAMAIFYVLDALAIKKLLPVLLAVLLVGANFLAGAGLLGYFRQTTGMPLDGGTPKIAWAAMGLQEGPFAPGWYNTYVPLVYTEMGMDKEETERVVREDICASLDRFAQSPYVAAKFFYKKISSTWNNPTYQSIWNFTTGDKDVTYNRLTMSLAYGKLGAAAAGFMNIYQTVIFLGTALFLLLRFKRIKREQLLLAVIFLGTFVFHLVWETKAQYVVTVFALLIPYAAVGWVEASGRIRNRYLDSRDKQKALREKMIP